VKRTTPAMCAALAGMSLVLAPAPGYAQPGAGIDPCSAQRAAYDQVRLRAQASQTTLELLRDYRRDLDQAYIATSRSQYHDASVDVASLAAGWPLGTAAEKYLLGKAENTMTEKLIKAGFKSVDKALLKDPRLSTIFDQVTAQPETLSGVQYDMMKQSFKNNAIELWGKEVAENVIGFYDVTVFGLKQYEGTKQLNGIRALGRSVDAQLVRLQTRHAEQMDILDNAKHAVDLCLDRVAKNLPPDNNNYFWRSVQAYLGSGAPAVRPAARPATIPDRVSAWSGSYTNGEETDTLSGSGNSLTGRAHWERAGGLRSDETLSACTVNGNTAVCSSKGTYEDADKTVTLTSKWELTLTGNTLSKKETITSATWTWKSGDKGYTPAVHKEAVFTGTYTRQ
jgi:hypothetical protein